MIEDIDSKWSSRLMEKMKVNVGTPYKPPPGVKMDVQHLQTEKTGGGREGGREEHNICWR